MQKVVYICIFTFICQTALTVGYEQPWILRQKRMTNDEECHSLLPGSGKKLPSCCEMPNILPGLDNAWEKCIEKFKQIKDKPETEEYKEMVHGKDPPCLFQCVFIQSKLATSDGKLNEEMITTKMSEEMNNDQNWKSLWEPALNKCFDEVKDENKKTMPMMNTPAGRLMKCFLRDLYMHCPDDIKVKNPECTNINNLVKNCPEMPPPVFKTPPKLI